VTEAEEAAAKAVSLAREVIDKYGADADKPSVKLAIALINGAHERDGLRTQLADALRQRDNVLRLSEAALESANQHALDEYARGVTDGSEINVNILEESKADLEEQRQEIRRLQMQIKEMQEHS